MPVVYKIAKGDKIDFDNSMKISLPLIRIIFADVDKPVTRLDKGDILHGSGFCVWAEEA